MFEIPALQSTERVWLLDGPLAAFVPAYVTRLKHGGYAPGTVHRCLGALAHFAHWMALCTLPAARLDESRADQFLHDHLPHCGCPEPALRHPREAHAAPMPLLAILRRQGVIAELPIPAGPIADELRRFDSHMHDARGLASGTRVDRLRIIERLLIHKFAGGALTLEELRPADIRRSLLMTPKSWPGNSARRLFRASRSDSGAP